MKQKLLLIGGPTAVGKTKLGIECAKLFNGEIISADCVQVYKGLNIGSAKATKEEQQQAKHHLIDIKEPTEEYSVAEFRQNALKLIDDMASKNKLPIVVGGTGLYIQSLLYPFSYGSSEKNEEIRKKYTKILQEKGVDELFAMLEKVDEETAKKLHKNDTKRVIRALEIFELTGKKKSEQVLTNESPFDYKLIYLNDDRKVLYDRINNRVDQMFEQGLESEVENLIKSGLTRDNQSMQGIGYREFFDYYANLISREQLIEKIKQDTRNYAKRQLTWFRHMQSSEEANIKDINAILANIKKWLDS